VGQKEGGLKAFLIKGPGDLTWWALVTPFWGVFKGIYPRREGGPNRREKLFAPDWKA